MPHNSTLYIAKKIEGNSPVTVEIVGQHRWAERGKRILYLVKPQKRAYICPILI